MGKARELSEQSCCAAAAAVVAVIAAGTVMSLPNLGLKPAGACSIQLGVKGRLDSVLRGLSNAMRSVNSSNTSGSNSGNRNHVAEHSKLLDALHQVISRHECAANSCSSAASRTVDLRDLPALLAIALPGCAHKELAELQAWMQLGSSQHMQQQQLVAGQQGVPLEEVEAAARDLLAARECCWSSLACCRRGPSVVQEWGTGNA
jgi:hypothetical protein